MEAGAVRSADLRGNGVESIRSIRVGGRTPNGNAQSAPELHVNSCADMDCKPAAASDAHAASLGNCDSNSPCDGHPDQHVDASAATKLDATAFKHAIEGPEPHAAPDVDANAPHLHTRGYKNAAPQRDPGTFKHALEDPKCHPIADLYAYSHSHTAASRDQRLLHEYAPIGHTQSTFQ
jgi:hypothetical protein